MGTRKAILLLLAGSIGLGLIWGGWWWLGRVSLRQDITRAVRMYSVGYASHIELAAFTDFEWDSLYLFPPYTPEAAIEAQLGFRWWEVGFTNVDESDSFVLLVFMHGGKVRRWVDFPRSSGDFSRVESSRPLTPENAFFFINPEGSNQIRLLRIDG